MAEITIRRAVTEDAEAITHCIDQAYAAYRDALPDLPDVSEGVAEDIEENTVFVATLDGRLVGCLILIQTALALKIANVAVSPSMRGTGLGRLLLEKADAEARRLGVSELSLTTHTSMTGNVSLYQHLGWSLTARTANKVEMSKPV